MEKGRRGILSGQHGTHHLCHVVFCVSTVDGGHPIKYNSILEKFFSNNEESFGNDRIHLKGCILVDEQRECKVHAMKNFGMTYISIDNFKNFNDFSMHLTPLTVVVGNNAVGKSSLLQAVVFLKYAATATIDEYMKDRNVSVDDLATKGLSKIKKLMSFTVHFAFGEDHLIWELTFLTDKTNNQMTLRSEKIYRNDEDAEPFLDYMNGKGYRVRTVGRAKKKDKEIILSGAYPCSLLRLLDNRNAARQYPELYKIKQFFEQTVPLDLLTPHDMRKTTRGKSRTLGIRGEQLPALISQLSEKERETLMHMLQEMLPHMTHIDSIMGRAGRTHLETMEDYGQRHLKVPTSGISDGTLRLMALFSLSFLQKQNGVTLLDEVEDGINTSNIEMFLNGLNQYIEEKRQQVLLTTHSTVVLDYVDSQDIRYLYRDENGFTHCKNFEDLVDVKSQLEFMYPGEILLNTKPVDLLGKAREK